MGLIETIPVVEKAVCDGSRCDAEVPLPPVYNWDPRLKQALAQFGWKMYAGRGRRYYCPDHEPTRGHKMRQVVP